MMRGDRPWLLAGGWVLVVIAMRGLGGIPLPALLGALALWALIVFGRGLAPRLKRSRSMKALAVLGTVEPPSARHAYKPATTLFALTRRLEAAELGAVKAGGLTVRVELPEGEWAAVSTLDPAQVTQASMVLEGSSLQALAITCDAIASELGAMCLKANGVELVIDGTRPRGLLTNDVADAVDTHRRRAHAELRRLERPTTPPRSGTYLH